MPRILIWFVAALLGVAGCGPPSQSVPSADYSEPIVLFVTPDSAEIHRLQQQLGDDFFVVADDAMWYRAAAIQLLDSLNIRHVDVGRGAAHFRVGGMPKLVSWEDTDRVWFNIVYDGNSEPIVSHDIDIAEAVANFWTGAQSP